MSWNTYFLENRNLLRNALEIGEYTDNFKRMIGVLEPRYI